MKNKNIKKMVGIALFAAIIVVLQVISGVILRFGSFSVTLCLVPIVIGGMIYGVAAGSILGAIFGLVCIFNALIGLDTGTNFMLTGMGGYTCVMTIFLCLLKGAFGGFISALSYKLLKNKNQMLAVVLACALCPIGNTGMFAIGFPLFLMDALKTFAGGENTVAYLFLTLISWNFFLELGISLVLIPAVKRIVNIYELNYNN